MEPVALRVEHLLSGPAMRAGSLHGADPNYPCPGGWFKHPDGEVGVEIRLAVDGDVDRFRGVKGITILEGHEAIDAAVAAIQPTKPTYRITSELLLVEYIRQVGIDITDCLGPDMSGSDTAKALHALGCAGVCICHPAKPPTCRELMARAADHAASQVVPPRRTVPRGTGPGRR